MKKLLAFAAATLMSLSVHAAKFEEGKHYAVLSQLDKSSSPVVTEFFSFYCPHCFRFEPLMKQVEESLPENAKFQKYHVSFMGGNMGEPMSKAFATAIVLNVKDTIVPILFDRIHVKDKAPRNEEELRQIFIDEGVDAAKFDGAYNGFAVNSMTRRYNKAFQDSGLRGVPTIVVNNQYQVLTQELQSNQDFIDVVNYLLTK
ncbi:thiol:disulfide interchange protein DsbA/DsbL [Thaumasiovibrio subtropicus]|uniref:thiol:disulfide interchange protein DsbA/DsbL n=1 Tax=Thaumasiovibrio subtropicus TaxID=1891207 RepID=UPI0018643C2E|nr:thiol:disulfide interchange protein DsbA/DsbL [Thaumasiovibrio subtropicus]